MADPTTPEQYDPCVVYALRDPRDTSIRYVGATIWHGGQVRIPTPLRLQGHITQARRDRKSDKDRWILELLALDLRPDFMVLSHHDTRPATSQAEVSWIAKLRAAGHTLFNVQKGGLGKMPPLKTAKDRT